MLTCVIDVQLIHDAFVPSAEDYHQLFNGYSSVSVSRARNRARPAQNPLPARLQNRGPRRSHVHFSSETQIPGTALILVRTPTAFVCQKLCANRISPLALASFAPAGVTRSPKRVCFWPDAPRNAPKRYVLGNTSVYARRNSKSLAPGKPLAR